EDKAARADAGRRRGPRGCHRRPGREPGEKRASEPGERVPSGLPGEPDPRRGPRDRAGAGQPSGNGGRSESRDQGSPARFRGQNDSRIGFNHCGYDWSLDRGGTWGDTGTSPPPFWQTILLDGHTTDACSDPAATFDHLGNAYVTGILFDIVSAANGIFVAKSN